MELHLLADTNLFFECRRLEDLPWAELGAELVILLVTKPVLDEIDKHKKSSGRTRKRALEMYVKIRQTLKSDGTEWVIRNANPQVIARLVPNIMPDQAHEGALDYGKTDDRLIGILSSMSQASPASPIVLLTHDTGPAASARMFGLRFMIIEDHWLRPPEDSSEAKTIRGLEREIEAYRSQEPRVEVRLNASNVSRLESRLQRHLPLLEPELEHLLERLRAKHPMKTDFPTGAPRPSPDAAAINASLRIEPPSADEIQRYQTQLYPQWLEKCREVLSKLHVGRDVQPDLLVLSVAMSNTGTRPATDVRVSFEAMGPVSIQRVDGDDDDQTEDQTTQASAYRPAKLPSPPAPPKGKTVLVRAASSGSSGGRLSAYQRTTSDDLRRLAISSDPFRALGISTTAREMLEAHERFRQMQGLLGDHHSYRHPVDTLLPVDTSALDQLRDASRLHSRDPEEFYYSNWPMTPVRAGSLTCALWRHRHDEECFEFAVLFDGEGEAAGSILCTIHASNLTEPAELRVPVSQKIIGLSLAAEAQAMIDACP